MPDAIDRYLEESELNTKAEQIELYKTRQASNSLTSLSQNTQDLTTLFSKTGTWIQNSHEEPIFMQINNPENKVYYYCFNPDFRLGQNSLLIQCGINNLNNWYNLPNSVKELGKPRKPPVCVINIRHGGSLASNGYLVPPGFRHRLGGNIPNTVRLLESYPSARSSVSTTTTSDSSYRGSLTPPDFRLGLGIGHVCESVGRNGV